MIEYNFGKIGVLAGGPTSEREISLRSGNAVFSCLKELGFDAELIELSTEPKAELCARDMDVAFIVLHGGYGEDGTIQNILEDLSIPYTGSDPLSSSIAIDKVRSKKSFIDNNVPVPEYIEIKKNDIGNISHEDLVMPLVIKPSREGSSVGLSIINNKKDMNYALEHAFKFGDSVLMERFIAGKEITVGILGEDTLPVIEILPRGNIYDFNAKYNYDDTQYIIPARISGTMQKKAARIGLQAHNALGCRDISRVDMRLDEKGRIYVLEVNTIPGMTHRSLLPKAAESKGLSFSGVCCELLRLAYARK